jgi:hypothetical protein
MFERLIPVGSGKERSERMDTAPSGIDLTMLQGLIDSPGSFITGRSLRDSKSFIAAMFGTVLDRITYF